MSSIAGMALVVVAASTARAQTSPIAFSVQAGGDFPTGNAGDYYKSGWTAGASLWASAPLMPVGLRIDGGYTTWDSKFSGSSKTDMWNGTANVILKLGAGGALPITPYLLGGVGFYRLNYGASTDETFDYNAGSLTETKFGVQGGGGIALHLSGFATFIEARYLHIATSGEAINTIPVVVGIRFGH